MTWTQVGTTELAELPTTATVGMFVTSPPTGVKTVRRSPTSTESSPDYTLSTAVFDSVSVTGADGEPVTGVVAAPGHQRTAARAARTTAWRARSPRMPAGSPCRVPATSGSSRPAPAADNDVVRDSLSGILIGFIAMAVIAALFITTEFRRGIIRTTFTATPRRGRVLAAKAVVLAALAFVTGVAAAVPAFLISQPLLRENGFAPPAYPKVSLTDGPVARAVVGTGLVLALLAVLALALGALLRSSAAAITLVIALVVLPVHHRTLPDPRAARPGSSGSPRAPGWRSSRPANAGTTPSVPWPGIAVLCGWVAVALAVAVVQLRRRDA